MRGGETGREGCEGRDVRVGGGKGRVGERIG